MTKAPELVGYTLTVKQRGEWWIGWLEDVPGVNAQERSREEVLESLRVILAEALELRGDAETNA